MPRLPTKLIVFTIVFACFWIFLAPKRAELATSIIRKKKMGRFQDSIQVLIEEKIRKDICTWQDMCSYRSQSWDSIGKPDNYSAEVTHRFYTDDKLRKFLFRVRNGAVSEVIDLR